MNSGFAIMTQFEAFDASEAIPLLPLAKEIKRAGMLYNQIFRQGDVATYCAKGKGGRIEYEVVKIQVLLAEEINGRSYPVREAFPSNSGEWGSLGFTYTDNSHRDPLPAAQLKAREQEATQV
ncbi:MAG: hypothetical protein WB696_04370 [Chthoniobacterales bacterium]